MGSQDRFAASNRKDVSRGDSGGDGPVEERAEALGVAARESLAEPFDPAMRTHPTNLLLFAINDKQINVS